MFLLRSQKRQKGGIGNAAHDAKQADIRAFFGGVAVDSTDTLDHSESNAQDEADVSIEQK